MFPDLDLNSNVYSKESIKSFIDAAINFHKNNASARDRVIKSLYNSHNGIVRQSTKKILEQKYGKQVSTKFIDYKLGYSKTKLLKGEYLNMEFAPIVSSINPDVLEKKVDFANLIKGASAMKSFLTALKQETGIDPLGGVEVPDKEDPSLLDKMYPKTANEIYMQLLLNEKIESHYLKLKGQTTLIDLIVTSECHGVIEKDQNGEDVFRIINPRDAVFQEIDNDFFAEESPFKGERRMMYVKDIIALYGDELSPTDKEKLTKGFEDFANLDESGFRKINGIPAVETYKIQYKVIRTNYTKVSKSKSGPEYRKTIEPEYYHENKKKIEKDVKNGKYTIEKTYSDDLLEGIKIGEDIYVGLGRSEYQVHRLNKSKKYKAEYDYVNFLFGTVDGVRISLQALINSLSELNNIIMHMIVREIKKLKGKVIVYDEALKPKNKSMKSIFFDMTEDGLLKINSSADGNYSGMDVQNASNIIQELDIGLSQSFDILLKVKNDVEMTLDRITGINESREGNTPISQTATGTLQNVEASRSITRDLFYGHEMFMNKVFSLLAEKTKLNEEYLDSNKIKILLGETGINFLKASKDLMFDDFDVKFSDGGKEREIRDRVRRYFDVEINSGKIRTKDVIKFELTKNLRQGIRILEEAWNEISALESQQYEAQMAQTQQQIVGQAEMNREQREDVQAHEKELKQMDIESKERLKGVELNQKAESEQNKNISLNN